jgi:polyketide cyclase/dehydrase/lipid transport protein
MLEIDVGARSLAAPERVWTLLADVSTWPRWAPFDDAEVESGEGVGEIRRFRAGRVTTRERVTELDPPRRYAYEFVSGLPIRDYRAEVTLSAAAAGGTAIRWQSSFRAKLPGTGSLVRRTLTQFVAETAEGLAREAEKPVPS